MRKLIAISIVLSLLLCGCGESSVIESSEIETTTTEEIITEEETTEEETLPISWCYLLGTDEFGDVDITEKGGIYAMFTGTFSNSATSSSDLLVMMGISDGGYGINLLEYGKINIDYYSGDTVTIKTKNDSGVITEYSNTDSDFYVTDTGIIKFDPYESSLLKQIINNERLRFIITIEPKYGKKSEYHFETDNNGLKDLMRENNIPEDVAPPTTEAPFNINDYPHWSITTFNELFQDNENNQILSGKFLGYHYTDNEAAKRCIGQLILYNDNSIMIRFLDNYESLDLPIHYFNIFENIKVTIEKNGTKKEHKVNRIYHDAICLDNINLVDSLILGNEINIVIETDSSDTTTTYKFTAIQDNFVDTVVKATQ